MMDPQFIQNLHSILQQCGVPDTNVVKQATAALTPILKDPKSVPALFQIISESPELAVRQLGAVELRKRIAKGAGKAWTAQAAETREAIKAKLLEIVFSESSALVRHQISRIISEIAKKELPASSWPQLLPFLFEASNSAQAPHRYVAIFTFYTLLETFVEGDALSKHLPTILGIFSKSIQDPDSLEVRVTTVRALGKIIQNLEDDATNDIQTMQAAVPQMVAVLNQCIEETNTEGATHIVDVFETVAMCEAPVLNQYLGELIEFFLAKGADINIEEDLRHMCLNSLIWLCQYKKSKIQSLSLIKPIISKLMGIATEADPEDADEDSPSRLALRIIDTLATEMPPSQVFPHIHEQMTQYSASSDPTHRKAAMMVFGVSVEGCSEYIRPHMSQLWPFIENGLQDGEVVVRNAACVALGCLCEMLDDECAARHATLLPVIMNLINDERTQRSACTGLDSLLEVMNEAQIAQYLPALMERLSSLLETAPIQVKATVTGAIGSAAHASKAAFTPYFQQTMQRIQPFLLLSEDGDETDLRGITIDTAGTFAVAVGAEAFKPYFEDLMKLAFASLELPNPRLRECSFIFFSTMSRVFGTEFGQFLGAVVPELLKSCQQSEHDPVEGAPGDGTVNGRDPLEVDDDGYVDIEDINDAFQNVNSAIAIEKEVAADALGEIFINTREAFIPFLEQSVEELVNMLDHFYQGIRKSAITSLFACINTLNSLSNPQPWEKGALVKVPLDAEVRKLVDHIIPAILATWEAEDDRTAAIEICTSLAECLAKNGPAIISPHHQDSVCLNTAAVLEGVSEAQIDADAEEGVESDESSEYESVLISGAMDLVGAMAVVLGSDFSEPLKQFLPRIVKFYAPARSTSERAAAIGALGEIVPGMGEAITPFTNDILSVLSRALSDEDVTVRSNAAYASGVLVENSQSDLSSHFNALLAAMQGSFQKPAAGTEEPQENKAARDNASGCLGRLILKNPNAVPLDQALPILFGAMPLEHDLVEWVPILHALMALVQSNNQVALSHLDTVLQLFAHVLGQPEALEGDVRGQAVAFISGLNVQHSEKIQANGLSQYLV